MRTAICSGSYDPVTLGHLDIIRRAAACFDFVRVCVSPNAEKHHSMFQPEQRLLLVQTAIAELPNVRAELFDGLLAEYAGRYENGVIVRGVRNSTDFDLEYQMARINRSICSGPETLFLPASPEYQHVSSSMAREMIRYHQPLEGCLPAAILPLIRRMQAAWGEGEDYGSRTE